MTSNHDHATLFVAPPAPSGTEPVHRDQATVDHQAEAMRRLRHPFAVTGAPATEPAR